MMTPSGQRLPVAAAILAGGNSSRMSTDKSLLELGGQTLVARMVDILAPVCAETMLVVGEPTESHNEHGSAGVRIITDEVPGLGPLGGLSSALNAASENWVLVVAVDMPFVSPALVRLLWAQRVGYDAVVPVTEKGAEPLMALYAKEPCSAAVDAALAKGQRRPMAAMERLRVSRVREEALRTVDPGLLSLENVNTREDLQRVRRILEDHTLGLDGSE